MKVNDFITDFFTTTDDSTTIIIPNYDYTGNFPFSVWTWKPYIFNDSTTSKVISTYVLKEKDNHYFIDVLCAGMDKDDIELSYKRIENVKYLVIIFKKENEFNKEKDIIIPLPEKVDPKTLKASLKNGILSITIDRQSDSYEKINIEIE